MKANNKSLVFLIGFLLLVLMFIGFRLVTQAGDNGYVVQNDGNAMIGGIMLLLSGFGFGWLIKKENKGK